MDNQEVWSYAKLSPLQRQLWDAMARAVEDGDLYTLAKYFLDKDLFEPRIHQLLGAFIMAPVIGKYDTSKLLYPTDYDTSQPTIQRGTMKGGDPLGSPYYYVTRISDPPSKRQLLLLARDTFKSTYMEALIIMLLIRDPNIAILVMGNDESKAKAIAGAVEQHMAANPKLDHYWKTRSWQQVAKERGLTWTIEKKTIGARTVNRQDPSIQISSLGALKPGPHFDVAIVDDLINEKTVASDADSATVNTTFDLMESMLGPQSVQFVIGTRWGKYDLYESLENHKTTKGAYRYDVYGRDSVLPNGQLWFPERKSEEVLLDKWESALRVGQPWIYWSQQRMQPITEAEKGLQLEKIHWFPGVCQTCGKQHAVPARVNTAIVVDPADDEAKGTGAWAIWAIAADCDKHFWDVDLTKARIKGDNALDETIRMIKAHRARACIVENTVIARRFITALEARLVAEGLGNVPVIRVEHHGQSKATRIMSVENSMGMVMAQERLYLRDLNHIIKVELGTFPGGNYTYDALDAGSYMTAWCSDPRNHFFPIKPKPGQDTQPQSFDERLLSRYHESCDSALKRRDQLATNPEFRWTKPGIREAVRQ